MGDPHGDLQTIPQHADPHGLGTFSKKTIQEIDVDRCVVGWSAGRHADHPCVGGKFRHGLANIHLIFKFGGLPLGSSSSSGLCGDFTGRGFLSFATRKDMGHLPNSQKKPRVRNLSAHNSGAGNGCPNFMGTWHCLVLCAGKPHAHKIPCFRGFLVFGKGGGVGRVKMEPFVHLAFFALVCSNFWPNLRPIPVARPVVVLWRLHLFYRHFKWFWGLGTPNSPFVLFGPGNALFELPKHYVLKGEWPILKRKVQKNGGMPKGEMVPFSCM